MPLNSRLRYEVLRRDGHRCVYCGASAKEEQLVVDHVVAVALGGTDDVANLVASCVPCNEGKASTTVDAAFVAQVDADAQRWIRAMAAAVVLRRKRAALHEIELDRLDNEWSRWTHTATGQPVPRPEDWRETAERMLMAGLPIDDMIRLVEVAMKKQTQTNMDVPEWRYYYGCCRRVLGEIEGTARALLSNEAAAKLIDYREPTPTLEDL